MSFRGIIIITLKLYEVKFDSRNNFILFLGHVTPVIIKKVQKSVKMIKVA